MKPMKRIVGLVLGSLLTFTCGMALAASPSAQQKRLISKAVKLKAQKFAHVNDVQRPSYRVAITKTKGTLTASAGIFGTNFGPAVNTGDGFRSKLYAATFAVKLAGRKVKLQTKNAWQMLPQPL